MTFLPQHNVIMLLWDGALGGRLLHHVVEEAGWRHCPESPAVSLCRPDLGFQKAGKSREQTSQTSHALHLSSTGAAAVQP